MNPGYVYVLSNPAMPGLVKIGKTTRSTASRAVELYQTGVPLPFVLEHEVYALDCHRLERDVHDLLPDKRVNEAREFFAIDVDVATGLVTDCHSEQISEFLEKFAPGKVLVDDWAFIDPSDILMLAHELDASPPDTAVAMSCVTAEELAPALARWRAKIEKRHAERKAFAAVVTQ